MEIGSFDRSFADLNQAQELQTDRIIHPPLGSLDSLRQPMTPGEKMVLDLFNRKLAPEWEIYIQPHLNGLRPDFVLLNPNIGIAVFEVKDWDLDAVHYFPQRVGDNPPTLWGSKDGQQFSVENKNPFTTIRRYKSQIFDLYCPRLRDGAGFAALTGGVIFTCADVDRVRALQRHFLKDGERKTAPKYLPVSGRRELLDDDVAAIFPDSLLKSSGIMSPSLAQDLRGWLVEPDFAASQRQPLELAARQRELVESWTANGFRRIKGPAGSGKSLVLAARAAKLISEGKSVLIVTYNITLWHYLRDLVVRGLSARGRMDNLVFTHFHQWCEEICRVGGCSDRYNELFSEVRQLEESNLPEEDKAARIKLILDSVLEIELPRLTTNAAGSPDAPRYDAILVDEGQDFLPTWWNALKQCRAPDGEMLLVADTTQDVYGKAKSWTDDAMLGAGFSGDWAKLETSYRLPRQARRAADDFARTFLPHNKIDLARSDQGGLNLEPCDLKWVQCEPEEAKKKCVDAILAMMRQTGKRGLANADITFICNEVSFGEKVTQSLDTYSGINTLSTFSGGRQEQQRRKMAFYMGDARIKATTFLSFKGWESRLLVVHIGNAAGENNLASIYAALTRLKRSPEGSWLTVICSSSDLAAYGQTWQRYIQLGNAA